MSRKTTAAALALLMLLSCASCSKEENQLETDTSGNILTQDEQDNGKVKVLTEVFRGEVISLPDEYVLGYGTSVSNDDGNISFIASKSVEVRDENGALIDYKTLYKVLGYDKDLNLISDSDVELKASSENGSVNSPTLVGNTVYFVVVERDSTTFSPTYSLAKYDITTGETVYSHDITDYFEYAEEMGFLNINNLFVDGSGNIYLTTLNEVLVLNADFIKQFSVNVPNWVSSASMSADKELYITSYFDEGSGIVKLNLESRGFDDPIYPGDLDEVYFGDGYDFYSKTDIGLYGYNTNEDGSISGELLMNFQNSDVKENSLDISAILSADSFIARYNDDVKLYTKSDDIDLSEITTIEIASILDYSNTSLTRGIVDYNSQHTESRVIYIDYSEYNTSENDYRGGYEKLMNEMLNGIYAPDIILTSSYSDYAAAIVENGLYTDLYPYIDAESDFGRDDIFDSVFREFSYDGKLWGITNQFEVETLAGKTSDTGDRTSWSCDEFIDFALSLDEEQLLMARITQSNAATQINGLFERFFDFENNTCNFETEDFYKTLEFIASLPPEEYDYSKYHDVDNRYKYYQDGTISLYKLHFYVPSDLNELKASFNNEETSLVGYPTAGENQAGGKMIYDQAFIITNCSENKDAAWDYIKSFLSTYTNVFTHSGFSIFKDRARSQCEEDQTMEYVYYLSGGAAGHNYDPENPTTEADLREPGVICRFSEEDTEKVLAYLNDCCGSPFGESISSDVLSMINEEISSFTSGAKSAEECAKVIQSRVSIYLAEHE